MWTAFSGIGNNQKNTGGGKEFEFHNATFVLGLSEIRQKMQRCRKNMCDGLKNVY